MRRGGLIAILVVLVVAPVTGRADDCGRVFGRWRELWAFPEAALRAKFVRCLAAAQAGDQNAQAGIGISYLEGDAVQEDRAAGIGWLEMAAAQDGAMALYNLGEMYWYGEWHGAVPRDPPLVDKAVAYKRRAAALGFAQAQYDMGNLHAMGRLVAQDYRIVAAYYRLAADQGHVFAQRDLAMLYLEGKGVKRDAGEAARLLHLAAAQESYHDWSAWALAKLYAEGRGVKRDLGTARHFYEMGIRAVDWSSHYALGMMYLRGQGGPKKIEDAIFHLTVASDNREPPALFELGQVYERGIEVPRDIDEARELYKQAAAKGHARARQALQRLKGK